MDRAQFFTMQIFLFLFVIYNIRVVQSASELITEYEWKYFDYEWKSWEQRDWYIKYGLYNPQNMIPIDVERYLGMHLKVYIHYIFAYIIFL